MPFLTREKSEGDMEQPGHSTVGLVSDPDRGGSGQ